MGRGSDGACVLGMGGGARVTRLRGVGEQLTTWLGMVACGQEADGGGVVGCVASGGGRRSGGPRRPNGLW
jgi:hypothetical protein